MTHLHFKDASKELIVCVELETPEERLAFNQFVLEKHSLPPNSSISLANRHVIWSHSPKGNFFALLSSFFFIKCEQIPHGCPRLAYWHWLFIVITVGPLFLAQCCGLWDSPMVLTTSVLEPQHRFFANLFSSSISFVNYFAGKQMISSSRQVSVQTEAGPSIFFNLAQTPLANSLNYILLFSLFYLGPPCVDPPVLFAAHPCICPHWLQKHQWHRLHVRHWASYRAPTTKEIPLLTWLTFLGRQQV